MNVIQAVQFYINNMISNIQGMKVLLLDKDTRGIVSMVYTQSQILQKEVFLFEKIDQPKRETMNHLKAICFLRPTEENMRLLREELKDPKYGEYHIFFTNLLRSVLLEELAMDDEKEVIKEVQEYFADYYAVNNDFFSLNVDGVSFTDQQMTRITDGLASVLLSLKKRPNVRYQAKSDIAHRIAQSITKKMNQETELFEFRRPDVAPLLLILDRREDPVTPLLMQWTYQSMVHELLEINNNRIDLQNAPDVKKDLKQVVLAPESDEFYKQNMYMTFDVIESNINQYLKQYEGKYSSISNAQTIEQIKQVVEALPEFRKLSGNVSKHVAVMSEISRLITHRSLMKVSALEQDLACNQNPNDAYNRVMSMISDPSINRFDKLKVALLYSIRYEEAGRVREVVDALSQHSDQSDAGMISAMNLYAGASVRAGDLFGSKNIFNSVKKMMGFQGNTNMFLQHETPLAEILDQVAKNKLRENLFPFLQGQLAQTRPSDVIVFVVGGATFEEALAVNEFNNSRDYTGVRVILGGTSVQNSHSFVRDVKAAAHDNSLR